MSEEQASARHARRLTTPLDLFERAGASLTFSGQCLLFVLVVSLAIFSISELAARETMLSLLGNRTAALKSDFVERTRVQAAAAPPTNAASAATIAEQSAEEVRGVALKQIERVEDLRRTAQALAALGTDDPSRTLRAIQRDFASLTRPESSRGVFLEDAYVMKFAYAATSSLLTLSSDQLLALVVIACGAIGAMISSLRAHQSLSLRSFVLGVASGFVAYLVIKGGKHIFLLQAQSEVVAFNPYGSAFAGLLAGLFTERAHQVLTILVDDLAERLRAATHGGAKHATPNMPPGKTDA